MMSDFRSDTWSGAWLMAATVLVLCLGTAVVDRTIATVMALSALGLALLSLFGVRWFRRATRRSVTVLLIIGIGLVVLTEVAAPPAPGGVFMAGVVLAGVLGVGATLNDRYRTPAVLGMVALSAALLAYLVATMVPTDIDVWHFQQEGAAALLSGSNPYALRYPNIYGPGTPFYAAEVMNDGFLTFGFPYPPVSLILALPGYALGGDYRYAAVAAVSLTAILIAFVRPGPVGPLAATMLLLSPLTFRVIYNGWTEPFAGMLVALTAFAAVRRPQAVPVLMGLVIAVKQYLVPLLPLALVLLRREPWGVNTVRTAGIAIGVAALSLLPFLAWDPRSFVYSVGIVQLLQPFRIDSVSVPGLIARAGGPELSAAMAFLILGAVVALVAWRAPRTVFGFCAGGVVVFLAFFLSSKQAFMNYYFFAAVLATVAVAVTSAGEGSPQIGGAGDPLPDAGKTHN